MQWELASWPDNLGSCFQAYCWALTGSVTLLSEHITVLTRPASLWLRVPRLLCWVRHRVRGFAAHESKGCVEKGLRSVVVDILPLGGGVSIWLCSMMFRECSLDWVGVETQYFAFLRSCWYRQGTWAFLCLWESLVSHSILQRMLPNRISRFLAVKWRGVGSEDQSWGVLVRSRTEHCQHHPVPQHLEEGRLAGSFLLQTCTGLTTTALKSLYIFRIVWVLIL